MTPLDREAELKRMNETLDAIQPRRAFVNARRICARQYQRSPNWVLAMELFGLGSTYAFALCRRFGIDPESTKIEPNRVPSNTSAFEDA